MRILAGLILALLGVVSPGFAQSDADEILARLSSIRLDKKQIFHVHDINIRRDALSISLNRGLIAFLEPVRDKVTGAVFIGSGEIVAIPPDSVEKQQVFKFTGLPILNETFQSAVLRFTDDSFQEIKSEILQHAEEEVTAEEAGQFDSLDRALAERSKLLDLRLIADFLETPARPLFLAELNGDKLGWFEVVFDQRMVEEVAALKIHESGGKSAIDLWASFNQRSEARNPEAAAHENKAPADILGYDIDTTLSADAHADIRAVVRMKSRVEGVRVMTLDLAGSLVVSEVSLEGGDAVRFYQYPGTNAVTLVLPSALKAGEEFALRFAYAGLITAGAPWYPSRRLQPAAMFKMALHAPSGTAVPATGNGMLSSAGFALGNMPVIADANGPADAVKYFAEILGPYPYESLTVLQSAANEQQSWPMLIAVPSAGDVMSQQIARQWFGHDVAPASYHDEWLFEGLSRYLGAMYVDSKDPGSGRMREFLNASRAHLAENEKAGAIWLGQRLASTVSPTGYAAAGDKGVWVIHMLRMLMRDDGAAPDARFLSMLRDFAGTYHGRAASTWEFKHVAEKYLPAAADVRRDKKLDWFFDDWVFGTGVPSYTLDYKIEPDGNAFVVQGTLKQADVSDDFMMLVPLFADDELIGRVTVGDTDGEFRFRLKKKPARVVIDPDFDVLAKAPVLK